MVSKKINLSLLLLMLAIGVQAQKTIVKGTIQGLTEPIIFRYFAGTVEKEDTVNLKNGQFTWKVKLPDPQKVTILFPKRRMDLYADKRGKIRITGHADSMLQLRISGSSLQKEADAYFASIKDLTNQIDELVRQLGGKLPEEKLRDLVIQRAEKATQRAEKATQYIKAHPQSYFSVSLLEDKVKWTQPGDDYREIQAVYDLLDPAMQQSSGGKRFSERLAAVLKRSNLGKMMPDFTLNSDEGRPVRFSDFKGKYVLVDVWASYCVPCRAQNPNILAAYNRYKDKNFTVLGISIDTNEDYWKKAIQYDKSTWTQVLNSKREIDEISRLSDIFLVDPDGKIIATGLHGQALHETLAELLDK